MLIDKSIACKIMVYPKYMIVNKTIHDIIYHRDQEVKSKTNDFVIGGSIDDEEAQKMMFRVRGFNDS
jgi:hypothetical protein